MSLQKRLVTYLKAHPNKKLAKGFLCDLARNTEAQYTGENTGRRLRYLESCFDVQGTAQEEPEHVQARALLEGGRIRVDYSDRKHAALYWYEPAGHEMHWTEKNRIALKWFDQLPLMNK